MITQFWPRIQGGKFALLWERSGGFQNFEGITLGPSLASGGRLVLLISDGGGHRAPHLLALRLTPKAAEAAWSVAPRTP